MKIRRRNCKSLKEFNKIIRKYIKYFRDNHIYHNYWYVWIWYDAIGLDNVKNLIPYAKRIKAKGCPNLLNIINEVINNYNWSFKHRNGKTYYLQGIEISNEDYYYIYVTEDGVKMYSTCVGRFTDVLDYAENNS